MLNEVILGQVQILQGLVVLQVGEEVEPHLGGHAAEAREVEVEKGGLGLEEGAEGCPGEFVEGGALEGEDLQVAAFGQVVKEAGLCSR